jgi:YbbR domain-containing protein
MSLIPEERTFSEKTVTIPLETLNIPGDMELVEKPEATVDVTVRAPNRLIDEIGSSNVVAKLNLAQATVFQQEYPLNETMISIPPGASVVRISPNKVRLRLERAREVLLDVVPNIIGQVKENYRVVRADVSPPRVSVKGPESKVREKDKVTTSPINISELQGTAEFDADVILPRPELRLAYGRNRVKVRVLIEEIPAPDKAEAKRKQ